MARRRSPLAGPSWFIDFPPRNSFYSEALSTQGPSVSKLYTLLMPVHEVTCPYGPDTSGAGERHTGESASGEACCIGKPDLLFPQSGWPAPSLRGRGIEQFLTLARI